MLMLLCAVTTWAQTLVTDASTISDEKVYTLAPSNTSSTGVICVPGTSATMLYMSTHASATQDIDATNINQRFAFLTTENGDTYLYSLGAQKFVADNGEGTTLLSEVTAECNVSFLASTGSAKENYPLVVEVGGDYLCISNASWWGDYGYVLTNWNHTDDAGCMMAVVAYDPTEEELELIAAANELLSTAATIVYEYKYNGNTLATQEAVAVKGADYPDLAIPALPLGYVVTGTKPSGTVSGNETVTIALSIDNNEVPFAFVEDGTPTTWYYAQMHAYTTGGYNYRWFIAPAEDGTSIRTQDHEFAANETDAHLWGFVGTVEGGFKMVNKGSGDAIKSENSGVAQMSSVADATAFIAMGSQIGADWFCMKNPAGNYLNSQGTVANATNCDFVIKHWSANDGGSSFYLTEYVDEDVTVTVSDAGWATMYLGEAVHVPAGVNAYIVTGVENGYLIKEQIAEGEAIPANTGILLENKGEYNFAKTVTYNVTFATNLLAGTLTDTKITKEAGNSYYILANGEEGIGFYNPVLGEDETKFNNAANKAYLVVPESVATEVACYSFRFGEGTTGIDEITDNREQSTVIYDLTGRRVEAITAPGIYVVNGKKVLVK